MSSLTEKKLQALILEDDLNSLEILTSILDDTGIISYESTKDSMQAIEYFKINNPQITFLDIELPGANGLETLSKMKKISPHAKIVMVTGHSEIETVKKAIALGAFGYVVKPFEPEKILSVIKRVSE